MDKYTNAVKAGDTTLVRIGSDFIQDNAANAYDCLDDWTNGDLVIYISPTSYDNGMSRPYNFHFGIVYPSGVVKGGTVSGSHKATVRKMRKLLTNKLARHQKLLARRDKLATNDYIQ